MSWTLALSARWQSSWTLMSSAIDSLSDWPVDTVAAAALTRDAGITSTHGDTSSVFPLASVSKLIAGYATLVAVEEGLVELDEPIPSTWLPASIDAGVTLRTLLAHASGLAMSDYAQQKPALERRIYSSAGFAVIARVIEEASSKLGVAVDFGEYVRGAVCEPLGMSAQVSGHPGHGYAASVDDLALLAAEFLSPTLVSPALMDEALSVQYPELAGIVPGYGRFNPCPWGLAFELHGDGEKVKEPHWMGDELPVTAAGHFGMSGTFLWIDRDSGTAAVVLTDREFGDWAKPLWQEFNTRLAVELRG